MEMTAKPIPKRRRIEGTGLESVLDFVAGMTLIVGGIAAFVAVIVFRVPGLLMCLSIVIGTLLQFLFLRCFAELIRLQKRIAGLEYSGRISGSYDDTVSTCSNCGAMLHSNVCCDGCGARIVRPGGDDAHQG